MSAVNPVGPRPAPHSLKAPPPNDDARLKKTATQMEGLFVQRLFAAMRERLDGADVPASFRGAPIALVNAGLMALAFMGFAGLVPG